MISIQTADFTEEFECPYLDGIKARNEYFFAMDLSKAELDRYLNEGWRKFGWYYFRPQCKGCSKCIPLRILTDDFKASRSQRKVLKKNAHTEFKVCALEYRDEIFELYQKHSKVRFDQDVEQQEFIETHYFPSCPAVQTEYYVDDQLAAVGFLDHSTTSLSSVYFVYDTDLAHLSLGVFSALMEIDLASRMQLPYYHLGYWIEENKSMRYKNKFLAHQLYDWDTKEWKTVDK